MAGRSTNAALFVLVPAAVASGALAYALGAPPGATIATTAHGVIGIAVILLLPWKQAISRRGLSRRSPVEPGVVLSSVLAAAVVVSVVAGFVHSTGLARGLGPLRAMQIHVAAGLVSLPLVVWHAVGRSRPASRTDLTKRNTLRFAGLAGAAAAAWVTEEVLLAATGLRGADRRFTGSHEEGSLDPRAMPVTQWLNDSVPHVDRNEWRLAVGGEVLSYEDLTELPAREIETVLDCTGGWWSRQRWHGVPLSDLLDGEPPSVRVQSVTGYERRFPGRELDGLLLVTRVGGEVLSPGHGFPARLVAPGRRGFWWVKWVVSVQPSDHPAWLQVPFPLS